MNKAPRRRGGKLRKIIRLLVLLLLLAAIGFYGYKSLKQEYTVVYDSYTATTGSISNALSFSGNLNLIDSASYTADASATVRKLYVAAGDAVSEGDKLLRLSNGQTVEAEFDGRVNTVSVAEGDAVVAGDALIQVADFSHMKITLRVDEYDISDVQVGQACTVTATATEKTFETEIAAIDYISASGGNVAYYSATAYVDVDGGVYPGMQATVSIPQEEAENVVILKADALSFDAQNSAYVWMYGDDGALEQVPVEVGVSNGNYVEIKSGLSDGDVVYVESPQETESSGVSGLLSGLFGGQQVNAPMGGGAGGNMRGEMPDFADMPGASDRGGTGGGPQMGGGGQ